MNRTIGIRKPDMMQMVTAHGSPVAYASIGDPGANPALHFIWGHGWGHDHHVFLPLARALERRGAHSLIDFPGFGQSPPPPATWTTADYADAMADWISTFPRTPRIWIGHSFGCRVGLQLASRHPGLIDGLFLIAA